MKSKNKKQNKLVVFHLNARLQPDDRFSLFEEPLNEMLDEYSLGEITGGGTDLKIGAEIESCTIEFIVFDYSLEKIQKISRLFETLDVPKGSKVIIESEDIEYPFGIAEGLAIYINFTKLDEDVYAQLNDILGDDGQVFSVWDTDKETILYLYGDSFATMNSKIANFVKNHPNFNPHRIEQIA